MSDFADDDELVLEYLAESREHLGTIEADLLAIEQRGVNIDENVVNRVFRAAHSIKGGAGFFDLLKIRDLAHRTESVLDLVRSRQMAPNSDVVSILLLAFDKLRELIQDHRNSNAADISEFLTGLSNLSSANIPAAGQESLNEEVCIAVPGQARTVPVAAIDLLQAKRAGQSLYRIECDLIHDVHRRGRTPLEVLNSLLDSGTIIDAHLDLDSAGTLLNPSYDRLLLAIHYMSTLGPAGIAALLSVAPENVIALQADPGPAEEAAKPEAAKPEAVVAAPFRRPAACRSKPLFASMCSCSIP